MFRRALLSLVLFGAAGLSHAADDAQAQLRFIPAGGAEKTAGIWVDGHYIGYIDEFDRDPVLLLPGMHTIIVRQAWYQDYVEHLRLEPGTATRIRVSMVKDRRLLHNPATAELKISAKPRRAAVFVDDQFAGHSGEFDGIGRAMLVTSGQHKLNIALPGYLPFEMIVNVRPHQKLKIKAELQKGSVEHSGLLVTPE